MKATDLFNYRKEDFETIALYTARKLSCTNYTRKVL